MAMKYDYFAFARATRDSRELTRDQKHVLYVLSLRADNATGIARPSIARIAEDADMSVSSVTRAMRGIRTMGCVTIVFNGRGSKSRKASEYKLNHPSLWSTTMVTQTIDYGQADLTTTHELHTLGEGTTMVTQTIVSLPGPEAAPEALTDLDPKAAPEASTDLDPEADLEVLTDLAPEAAPEVVKCPTCSHSFPPGLSKDSDEFRVLFLRHFETAHTHKAHSEPLKPQGLTPWQARMAANSAKWECTQCGGEFSYLGRAGQMCHRCKSQIEG